MTQTEIWPVKTSALGFITSYEYDSLGRVSKKTNADGSILSYTYDANGNILTFTDGNGGTVAYTYDARNQLLTTTTPNGGVLSNTYTRVACWLQLQTQRGTLPPIPTMEIITSLPSRMPVAIPHGTPMTP